MVCRPASWVRRISSMSGRDRGTDSPLRFWILTSGMRPPLSRSGKPKAVRRPARIACQASSEGVALPMSSIAFSAWARCMATCRAW
jgi:hypothetical protein